MPPELVIRPLAAHDAERVQAFVRALSPQSRRERYFSAIQELRLRSLARGQRDSSGGDLLKGKMAMHRGIRLFAGAAALGFSSLAWGQIYDSSYESKGGPNDQIGALNNITAQGVVAAAKLVKRGKAIRLGIETNSKTPAFPPRTFALMVLMRGQEYGGALDEPKTNYNDDIIKGRSQPL